jgi:hypothetical protein
MLRRHWQSIRAISNQLFTSSSVTIYNQTLREYKAWNEQIYVAAIMFLCKGQIHWVGFFHGERKSRQAFKFLAPGKNPTQ